MTLDPRRLTPRRIAAVLAVVLPTIAAWVLFVGWVTEDSRPFEAEVWRANPQPDSVRKDMAEDLVVSDILLGKTKVDVEALLGPPTHRRVNQPSRNREQLNYRLGMQDGLFAIDSAWVGVVFHDGIATDAYLWTD